MTSRAIVSIPARLRLVATEAGGRQSAVASGYRPNYWIGRRLSSEGLRVYAMAEIELVGREWLEPGEEADVRLKLLGDPEPWQGVPPGAEVEVFEGPKLVGIITLCQAA